MKYDYLLFDLDGTITDPLEGIWRSLNFALKHFGYNRLDKNTAARYIGPPLDEIFADVTGSTDPRKIAGLVATYRERFSVSGYKENTLYPGIKAVLADLAARPVCLAVCTSKRKDFAEKILELFGLSEYFAFISGGDTGIKKVNQINTLLLEGRVDRQAVMIGDRAIDLTAAHQNGMHSAAVLWGYGSREELEAESPKYLFTEPAELLSLIC